MRRARLTTLLAGAVLALTACGGDGGGSSSAPSPSPFASDSPEQVLAKARDAAKSATSVRMSGSISDKGRSIKVDMVLSDSQGASGSVTQDGETMQIRHVDGALYLKGGAFATQGGGKYADKWIRSKAGDGGPAHLQDLASMDKALGDMLTTRNEMKRVAGKDVSGTPTVGLQDVNKDESAATLYIAAKGPAYPLLIQPLTGPGSFGFSDWNKPVSVTAPPADEVVDISKLTGR